MPAFSALLLRRLAAAILAALGMAQALACSYTSNETPIVSSEQWPALPPGA